jgi:hypothetical protein
MERRERTIQMGIGGWTNPDSDIPCGPADPTLKSVEPVHIGGCKGCRAKIAAASKEAMGGKPYVPPIYQMRFDF